MKTPDTTFAMPSALDSVNFTNLHQTPQWLQPMGTFENMKRAKRWLVHKNKVPHYVDGVRRRGTLDEPEDISRLATYQQAKLALSQNNTFDGLGFALGDGWQGIDLDKITDSNAHLASLVGELPGYVEKSPSGKGVHAIGRGVPIDAIKGNGIEVYCRARFFTVTEQTINDAPITDLAPFVNDRLVPLIGKRGEQTAVPQTVDADQWSAILSALEKIPADCSRDEWIRVGQALHATGRVDALSTWQQWSEQAPDKFPGERELMAQWRSFRADKAVIVTSGTIFAIAKRYGWVRPHIDVSDLPWADVSTVGGTNGHPLTRYLEFNEAIKPVTFVLQDLIEDHGLCVIAGARGVGKTTNLVPLIAVAAHLCRADHQMRPPKPRRVIYLTEDSRQVHRVLQAVLRAGWATPDLISDRFKVVDTKRLQAVEIVKAAPHWRELAMTHEGCKGKQVDLLPWIVFDTLSASFNLESENDNAELSSFVATLRQGLPDFPICVISHIAKAAQGRTESSDLTSRGAGSLEADATGVLYLVNDGGTRALLRGKQRFESVSGHHEVTFKAFTFDEAALDQWGVMQPTTLRCSLALFADQAKRQTDRAKLKRESVVNELYRHIRTAFADGRAVNRKTVYQQVSASSAIKTEAMNELIRTERVQIWLPDDLNFYSKGGIKEGTDCLVAIEDAKR